MPVGPYDEASDELTSKCTRMQNSLLRGLWQRRPFKTGPLQRWTFGETTVIVSYNPGTDAGRELLDNLACYTHFVVGCYLPVNYTGSPQDEPSVNTHVKLFSSLSQCPEVLSPHSVPAYTDTTWIITQRARKVTLPYQTIGNERSFWSVDRTLSSSSSKWPTSTFCRLCQ